MRIVDSRGKYRPTVDGCFVWETVACFVDVTSWSNAVEELEEDDNEELHHFVRVFILIPIPIHPPQLQICVPRSHTGYEI